MPSFDFITDEAFRTVLEADLKEMEQCFESKAWKAVHVLAGSIIEAVLIDYLIAEGHEKSERALKMDLGNAIKLATEKGIISAQSKDLSNIIRGYRNLIHPGRSIRACEDISEESASIAMALVRLILSKIEGRKRSNYGYTAEQIVAKVERDPAAGVLLKHLLKDVNPYEMERLLLDVVPSKYMSPGNPFLPETHHFTQMLVSLFRMAYEQTDKQLQTRVAQRFVTILKEGATVFIFSYSRAFFRMSDLQHLSLDEGQLVKDYFFDQIKRGLIDEALILALSGIGKYLLQDEVSSFVDPLVKTMCFPDTENVKKAARERIIEESRRMEETILNNLKTRLGQWIHMYHSQEDSEHASLVEILKSSLDEVPF